MPHDRKAGPAVLAGGGAEVRVQLGAELREAPPERQHPRLPDLRPLGLGGADPPAFVRITPETAPNWIQRASSSGVSRSSDSVKKPPTSEPQSEMPDRPIVSA